VYSGCIFLSDCLTFVIILSDVVSDLIPKLSILTSNVWIIDLSSGPWKLDLCRGLFTSRIQML